MLSQRVSARKTGPIYPCDAEVSCRHLRYCRCKGFAHTHLRGHPGGTCKAPRCTPQAGHRRSRDPGNKQLLNTSEYEVPVFIKTCASGTGNVLNLTLVSSTGTVSLRSLLEPQVPEKAGSGAQPGFTLVRTLSRPRCSGARNITSAAAAY